MPSDQERREALERLAPFVERARAFSGWDFPDMRVAILGQQAWDYPALVREYASARESALDLGTGGGELLASLRDALPARTVATEEWHVNAPVAYRNLRPLGVPVVRCRSLMLPFANGSFDLVIDRHEELSPEEVARALRPGGCLVTQQIGRNNWRELGRFFRDATAGHRSRVVDFSDIRREYARGLEAAGLRLLRNEEHDYEVAYESLGDFVFMLLITPWTIQDFDVERDIEALLALEAAQTADAGLVMTWGRILLVAEKPRPSR